MVIPVKQQKIHHLFMHKAVNHVTKCAADNHRRCPVAQLAKFAFGDAARQIAADYKRQHDKQIFLRPAHVGKKAKRCTGVVHQCKVKKMGDDVEPLLVGKAGENGGFADLVKDDGGNRHQPIGKVFHWFVLGKIKRGIVLDFQAALNAQKHRLLAKQMKNQDNARLRSMRRRQNPYARFFKEKT